MSLLWIYRDIHGPRKAVKHGLGIRKAVVQSNYSAKKIVDILPLAYIMNEMDVTRWDNQPPTITAQRTLIKKH